MKSIKGKVTFWHQVILFLLFLTLAMLVLLSGAEKANLLASSISGTLEKSPSADTYVAEGRPNEAPSAPDLKIFWVGHNQSSGFGRERALLKFDISTQEIPIGSTIQSARLLLTLSGTTTNDGPMDVTAQRILTDTWAENLTWNTHLNLPIASTNAATISVSRDLQQYEWNLQGLVQEWASSPIRIGLSLRLDSNQTSGNHERNFWSKDCKDNECTSAQRPKLVIQFEPPVTPTATSTATPTPTNTPTPTITVVPTVPTPGIEFLKLEAEPTGTVDVGGDIHYLISFKANNIEELEPYELTNVILTDIIPEHVRLVTDSLSSNIGYMVTYTGVNPGDVITWTKEQPLLQEEGSVVSYRVTQVEPAEAIYNDGVDMSWAYNDMPNHARSNYVRNPPFYLSYMPVAGKNPTPTRQK